MRNFIVYKSGAGSGKTFTLVKEYLSLCLRDPEKIHLNYRQVLAVTFTNKAAAEMKNRVIESLDNLSAGKPGHLGNLLVRELGVSADELQSRAQILLSAILHHYSDFSIGTLDSFTHRLVKTFAFDLQLPMNFEIELDEEAFYTEVVQELISQTGEDAFIGKLLKDYVLQHSKENSAWDPESLILAFAKLLYKENTAPYVELLNSLTEQELQHIHAGIRETISRFYAHGRKLAGEALGLIEQQKLTWVDFHHGEKGPVNFFHKIHQGKLKGLDLNSKRLLEAIHDGKWLKTTAPPSPETDRLKTELSRIGKNILTFFEKDYREFALCKLLEKRIYPLLLLKKIEEISVQRKEESQVVFISEFNRKLYDLVQSEPAPFVYERLGERYRHYLVDEFQDTSTMQWQNLLPLIDNSLASGNINLLVGDGKQSVYRWRNADVKQFTRLPKLQGSDQNVLLKERETVLQRNYEERLLDTNYRSLEELVSFNNQLFQQLSAKLLQGDNQEIYRNCAQKSSAGPGGYVSISTFDKENEEADEFNFRGIEQHLAQALEQGFRIRDICILCRSNYQAQKVTKHLLSRNFPVISPDSLLLCHIPEVQALTAFLHYLLNPEDQIASATVLSHFYGSAVISAEQYHQALASAGKNGKLIPILQSFGFDIQASGLELLNPFDLCLYLVKTLHLDQRAALAIRYFLDEVHHFAQREQPGLPAFLEWWKRRKNKASVVTGGDAEALKVMTIHSSKGLEFPVVIVPYCDWKIEAGNERWMKLKEEKLRLPVATLVLSKELAELGYSEEYEEETQSILLDHLNVLYVAFTRAVERLHILCQNEKGTSGKVNNWLLQNLPPQMKSIGLNRYECGSAGPPAHKSALKGPADLPLRRLGFSSEPFEFAIRKAARYNTTVNQAIDKGLLMHELLAQVKYRSDLPEVLERAQQKGLINENSAKELEMDLQFILDHEALRASYQPGVTLRNEAELVTAQGKILRPDRIVFGEKDTVLIDYKTGKTREKEHAQQLALYAAALREMGYPAVRKVLVYLDLKEVIVLNS